jgi:hypothetical protein
LRAILQRGVDRHEFELSNLEAGIDVVLAPLMMLVIWRSAPHFCGRDVEPESFLQTYFELLVNGLCSPRGIQ